MSKQVPGNSAALREALETVRDAHYVGEDNNGDAYEGFNVEADDGTGRPLICVVEEALEKPPRACDVMSQEALTKVVTNGIVASIESRPDLTIVGAKALIEVVVSSAIKCAYDTQLVSTKEGEAK